MEKNSDVLIVGGGLAGLTSAIHLTKSGFKVIKMITHLMITNPLNVFNNSGASFTKLT